MARQIVSSTITLVDERVRFQAEAGENQPIFIDYAPPMGTGDGYNSMQLLLLSLSSCTATTLINLMRERMRCTITGMEVSAQGALREEHPKTFEKIEMRMILTSPDATEDKVKRALDAAEEKLCPVWALLKGNVAVETTFEIKR